MRILIADDGPVPRMMLARTLERWKFDVLVAEDGAAAWDLLREQRPAMAILDWMMPGLDGIELCRRIRANPGCAHMYVILLTSRDDRSDTVTGLDAGADDYLVKPFDPDELRARVGVGVRVATLQERLAERVVELQAALSQVRQLHGLLPICSYCKRIRSDQNSWQQIEGYVSEHADVEFSHGICPPCLEKVRADWEK